MLNRSDHQVPGPLAGEMKVAAFADGGGGATLQLTPAAIVVRVEVDAQFTAD